MIIKNFLVNARGRAGKLLFTVTATAVIFAGIGDARAEQDDVTPEDVYVFACAQCHQTGLNAAPKFGNRQAWSSRIEKGREKMYENTINGMGAMPPKGGKSSLTEEQVKMAVDYMVNKVGGWPEGN